MITGKFFKIHEGMRIRRPIAKAHLHMSLHIHREKCLPLWIQKQIFHWLQLSQDFTNSFCFNSFSFQRCFGHRISLHHWPCNCSDQPFSTLPTQPWSLILKKKCGQRIFLFSLDQLSVDSLSTIFVLGRLLFWVLLKLCCAKQANSWSQMLMLLQRKHLWKCSLSARVPGCSTEIWSQGRGSGNISDVTGHTQALEVSLGKPTGHVRTTLGIAPEVSCSSQMMPCLCPDVVAAFLKNVKGPLLFLLLPLL